MFDWISDATLAALVGLIGGVLLGLAARLGRFCTLGAIEDALYGGTYLRLSMWGMAVGVAMAGCFALMQAGLLTASDTVYLQLAWNPVGSVIGGLVFGYGMALSGNCGFGALARLGGGDLRSFVIVLVMGLSAYVAISGPLARLRIWLFPEHLSDENALPSFAHGLARATGLSPGVIGMTIGGIIIAAMLANPALRAARGTLFWGAVAGLAVVIGWGGTAWIHAHGFSAIPVESHTYSAPIGDMILYLMTSSGNSLSFGVGSVVGVLLGAFLGSLRLGHFRWEACEDPRELKRQIVGAVLMGWGAVVAFGCSVGQGLSGFALLYYGAPVAVLSIVAGAAIGLRHLISGFAIAE